MQSLWSTEQLTGFQNAVQSLKLYRRAELVDPDEGSPLIEQLYVDPQPEELIFKTILRPHTTMVIGRKGTGKSTIFQRVQSELRKHRHLTSAYVDIKTVYESSQVHPAIQAKLEDMQLALPPEALEELLLYKEFVRALVTEIKQQLKKRAAGSFWSKIKERFSGTLAELFEGLDNVVAEATEERFINILSMRVAAIQNRNESSLRRTANRSIGGEYSVAPKLSVNATDSHESGSSSGLEVQYSDVLLRTFNVKELIARIKEVLERLGIRHLYVLVDDFSELPEPAMRLVVDVLLAPLNNWSDEFIKFKVAAYPGRVYYGEIDKSKIDEVYLDLYQLYGRGDVGKMEDSAVDFTRRLVEQRIEHFCAIPAVDFFESSHDEVWKLLFYASMANPRTLGYLLHYMNESHLVRGRRIGAAAIQEAAERYYDEKVSAYFRIGKFLQESFSERASIFSLKELLEDIVDRARQLRSHDSDVIRRVREQIGGYAPTSHFHVPVSYEGVFSSLELNFFLTKYFEMADRDKRKVAVYALNFGLCSKHAVKFGRPTGERKFRTYFIERVFDYTPLVLGYLQRNQEISCGNCGERFSVEQLDALRLYHMACPQCRDGTVQVQNLSRKYETELRSVEEALLLPPTELGILQTLHTEQRPLRPSAIGDELDCSYQLIGWRGKALEQRGLVKRYKAGGQRLLEISEDAASVYFEGPDVSELDLPDEE